MLLGAFFVILRRLSKTVLFVEVGGVVEMGSLWHN